MSVPVPADGRRVWSGIADCAAMCGRNLRRLRRAPDQGVLLLVSPIVFTLLFRYVFGGAITGLGSISYVNYLIPGIAVQTLVLASGTSGFALAEDQSTGFIDRLRSLPMAGIAVPIGRVATDAAASAGSLLTIIGVGLVVGFRPHDVTGTIAGFALILAFAIATSLLFAWLGLRASSAQSMHAVTNPVVFPLIFVSSAFVPTAEMPHWLWAFADHQPVSAVINAARDLMLGNITAQQRDQLFAGQSATELVIQALAWIIGLAVIFGSMAIHAYNTRQTSQ